MRKVLSCERFCDMVPRHVFASLLDEGRYLCHRRTIYQILSEGDSTRERRRQR